MTHLLLLPKKNLENPLRLYHYHIYKKSFTKKPTLKELLLSDENRFDLEIPKSEPYRQRDLTELVNSFYE